jgi:hypothetical protein
MADTIRSFQSREEDELLIALGQRNGRLDSWGDGPAVLADVVATGMARARMRFRIGDGRWHGDEPARLVFRVGGKSSLLIDGEPVTVSPALVVGRASTKLVFPWRRRADARRSGNASTHP